MKTIRTGFLTALAFVLGFGAGNFAQAEAIKAYTAVLPPFTLGSDQSMPGISHEILAEMSSRAGVEIEIVYLPWKRAQAQVKDTPNTLLFTAARTGAREPLYNWITEVIVTNEVFATLSDTIDSFENAQGLKRVAALAGSPRERRLKEANFGNLYPANDTATAARLLGKGRVDAWYTFDHRVLHAIKSSGLDPNNVVIGKPIRTSHLWLASNLEFDDQTADALAAALVSMREDGTYDDIVGKYLN